MIVIVNGEAREVSPDCTVGRLAPDQRGVAVAVNREIVPRSRWSEALLAEGDRIEILEAAKGG
ncbi:sulfur carrier protein ThiS [Candidatus Poriferisocius sp.]|uniref:sulfur carrier protein ThiS n=1 Tax=Candidatus Poriferisocius sp. TaxID=3101276 RepID=UPI003B0278E3